MNEEKELVSQRINEAIGSIQSLDFQKEKIIEAARLAVRVLESGGKIIFAGNGGSAADAQHAAAELVGRLGIGSTRKPLAAIAITTDTSAITAIANDFGFEEVFARQLEAIGRKDDLLVVISTSGSSPNIVRVAQRANELEIPVIALIGGDSSYISPLTAVSIEVAGKTTPRVQEGHSVVLHIFCELIERLILGQAR